MAELYANEGIDDGEADDEKPTWDDDIDINDLVPDFEADAKEKFSLSDDDEAEPNEEAEDEDGAPTKKKVKPADRKRARLDSQKQARKERAQLEALFDSLSQARINTYVKGECPCHI